MQSGLWCCVIPNRLFVVEGDEHGSSQLLTTVGLDQFTFNMELKLDYN